MAIDNWTNFAGSVLEPQEAKDLILSISDFMGSRFLDGVVVLQVIGAGGEFLDVGTKYFFQEDIEAAKLLIWLLLI